LAISSAEGDDPRVAVVFSEIAVKGLVVSNVPPPLLGFNNNVRHRGRIFHIQTEDSGSKNPRIVTHLFADGGRIIKTTRTDYAEHVSRGDLQVYVRSLMKEQHKSMFTALRLGELDTLLESICGPFEQPAQVSKSPPPMMSAPPPSEAYSAPLVTRPAPAPETESETPPPSASFDDEERPSEAARRRKRALSNPNLRKVTPSVPPPNAAAFELDVAALERLPAKPALPRLDRTPEPATARPLRKSNPAPARKSRPAPPQSAGKQAPPPSLSRPASRFAAGPSKSAQSIFGDGVISEQSLDEVILSYLAEDLDGSSE
jgi:hypothetical protein